MTASAFAASLQRIGEVQAHLSGPLSVLLALVAAAAATSASSTDSGPDRCAWTWPIRCSDAANADAVIGPPATPVPAN